MQVITATEEAQSITDLGQEWRVVAFRPNRSGTWFWHLKRDDQLILRDAVSGGDIVTVHRRDEDGTRLLAKMAAREADT